MQRSTVTLRGHSIDADEYARRLDNASQHGRWRQWRRKYALRWRHDSPKRTVTSNGRLRRGRRRRWLHPWQHITTAHTTVRQSPGSIPRIRPSMFVSSDSTDPLPVTSDWTVDEDDRDLNSYDKLLKHSSTWLPPSLYVDSLTVRFVMHNFQRGLHSKSSQHELPNSSNHSVPSRIKVSADEWPGTDPYYYPPITYNSFATKRWQPMLSFTPVKWPNLPACYTINYSLTRRVSTHLSINRHTVITLAMWA